MLATEAQKSTDSDGDAANTPGGVVCPSGADGQKAVTPHPTTSPIVYSSALDRVEATADTEAGLLYGKLDALDKEHIEQL